MISKKEFEAVTSLSPEKRGTYLMKRIADTEEVWVLFNEKDGYALNMEDDGTQSFPVWPFKEFADTWIEGEFSKFSSVKVDVYKFKDEMVPKLLVNGIRLLLFPAANEYGCLMNAGEFIVALNKELSEY